MPHQPELSSSHFRTAAESSASRPLLSAKAARKRITSEESTSDSLSGDGHSAIARGNQHDDSDSDALQRRSNQAVGGHRRLNLSTKTAKKVAFNVQDDSASDDGTVRADPSQHRGPNNLPAKSGAFFLKSPPAKQSGPKGGTLSNLRFARILYDYSL
ncbi:hypothetical protein BDN67DRAFT_824567 [Paxillus ammoniavirescens]|nr:hypothetical protein BDN67DRAFT_824567 [Paxillus ammoniavirescens]